jgi:hypothetical protein
MIHGRMATQLSMLQVIINRKKKRLALPGDIVWPIKKFNEKGQCLMPRMKNDLDVDVYNIVIENQKTKADDIRKHYMLRDGISPLRAFCVNSKMILTKTTS